MKFSTHAAFTNANRPMTQMDIEAASKTDAINAVFSMYPPGYVESVTAWPVRGDVRVCIDAPSLRLSKVAQFDSAFGCLA